METENLRDIIYIKLIDECEKMKELEYNILQLHLKDDYIDYETKMDDLIMTEDYLENIFDDHFIKKICDIVLEFKNNRKWVYNYNNKYLNEYYYNLVGYSLISKFTEQIYDLFEKLLYNTNNVDINDTDKNIYYHISRYTQSLIKELSFRYTFFG